MREREREEREMHFVMAIFFGQVHVTMYRV
jgi:hypothetical protein